MGIDVHIDSGYKRGTKSILRDRRVDPFLNRADAVVFRLSNEDGLVQAHRESIKGES